MKNKQPVVAQPQVSSDETSEEEDGVMDNYDPLDELAKLERKNKKTIGPNKNQRRKLHNMTQKEREMAKLDARKKTKMSNVTTLQFKEEKDTSKDKKKPKKVVEDTSSDHTMSFESASQFLTTSLDEIFERAKTIYNVDNMQLREVIESLQNIFSMITWKHSFQVDEPLCLLEPKSIDSLKKFVSLRDSDAILQNLTYLIKVVYDDSGAESKPTRNVGYKLMLQLIAQARPIQLAHACDVIFKHFVKTGKPLENFYWIISQVLSSDASQAVYIWSKTLAKQFKQIPREKSVEYLSKALEHAKKFEFDAETFCWIQKRALIEKDLLDLYHTIKSGIDLKNLKYFEEMAKNLDKHPSQADYIKEVASIMRTIMSSDKGQEFYINHFEKYFASWYIVMESAAHISDLPDLTKIEKHKKSQPKKYEQVEKLFADLSVKSGPNVGFIFIIITICMMLFAFAFLKFTTIGQELKSKIF